MRKNINVVLIGPMGAGKTSIGKALAKEIGWKFYDSDQVIEQRAGADILWIQDIEGEVGIRLREQKVISELVALPNIVLATGGTTVGVAANRSSITNNSLVVYLRASLDDQLLRTGRSKKRPLAKESEARLISLNQLHKEYVGIYEEMADIIYDTDDYRANTAVINLAKLIRAHQGFSGSV